MRDILSMIRKKDLEYLCGKMVESMKENGNQESSMDLDNIQIKKMEKAQEKDSGKMESLYNGSYESYVKKFI